MVFRDDFRALGLSAKQDVVCSVKIWNLLTSVTVLQDELEFRWVFENSVIECPENIWPPGDKICISPWNVIVFSKLSSIWLTSKYSVEGMDNSISVNMRGCTYTVLDGEINCMSLRSVTRDPNALPKILL